jgi:hypothetical protein
VALAYLDDEEAMVEAARALTACFNAMPRFSVAPARARVGLSR